MSAPILTRAARARSPIAPARSSRIAASPSWDGPYLKALGVDDRLPLHRPFYRAPPYRHPETRLMLGVFDEVGGVHESLDATTEPGALVANEEDFRDLVG